MRRKNKGVNITFSLYPTRRRPMLAPPCRQSLNPPSGHANRTPRIPPCACPCWRRSAGKALIHRRATPTGRPESRPTPAHVGAAPPAKPYPTVGPRQQGTHFSRRPAPVTGTRRAYPASRRAPFSRRVHPLPGGPARSPKGPLFPAGLPLFPVGP